jgi:hypothetical protein
VIGGELGEEFVVGDAGRSRELGFRANPCPDFLRDLNRLASRDLRRSQTMKQLRRVALLRGFALPFADDILGALGDITVHAHFRA